MGDPGSGKSTVAKAISDRLDLPYFELDAVHWLANWQMKGLDDFRGEVRDIAAEDKWVVDGNYTKVRDIILARADTLIFLSPPLFVSIPRLIKRTLRRVFLKEELWAGNRESIKNTFFSSESLILFSLRSHKRRGQQFLNIQKNKKFQHFQFHRFRKQSEIDAWISSL
jgi:adenylate kinase family enzyme